ncbi:hypothetical protein M427DRAFT_144151 [Gonapodya prolifera JEL478]|uniref:Purine-cytosine permease n=1 Tax=Gonapodya prolifera (strain JEL478) TaxID=1344416 RepID=A0A139AMH2_GONPJ|nr:hypothetical protein M427DRAFT_144151 [Gonapodya prolifera JEL478]|eukprot:KXS17723.1 hypothetical protein M427DRAFT_144151 [Gonapodya prolifera JEL478]
MMVGTSPVADDKELQKLEEAGEEFKFDKEVNKVGVEIRGIERVLPEDRHHTRLWENLTVWMSANMCLSTLATGALGIGLFGLSLTQGIACVVIVNALCCAVTAYFSTFGPRLGMRQMIVTRYSFGYYPTKFVALLNGISCIGWSMVNSIVGGLLLESLSDGKLPAWGGIILLAGLTVLVGIFGYQWVHAYERVAFLPLLIVFLIILGKAAPYITNVPSLSEDTLGSAGSILSFIGTIIGFAIGWSGYAADYNCNMPEDSNVYLVGFYTFVGLYVPFTLLEIIGLLVVSTTASNDALALAYQSGTANLVNELVKPLGGFGTFCMVLLALSTIANNIPNDYSLGLCIQVVGPAWFLKIKRHWWTLIGSIIYVVVACVGANNFESTLENFLLIVGYWGSIYWVRFLPNSAIVLTEEAFRWGKYDVHAWNNPDKLPLGISASLALACGAIGAILGMAQVWYVGAIALKFGPFGGDLGCELGIAFAVFVYAICRPIEAKYAGRHQS